MSAEDPPFVELVANGGVSPGVRAVLSWLPGQDFESTDLRVPRVEWLFTSRGEGDDQERVGVEIVRKSDSESDTPPRTLTAEELASFAIMSSDAYPEASVVSELVEYAQDALRIDMLSLATLSGRLAARGASTSGT